MYSSDYDYSNDASDRSESDDNRSRSRDRGKNRCRWGRNCQQVGIGQCRNWHPACRFGMNCRKISSRTCDFFHPPFHYHQISQTETHSNGPDEAQERSSRLRTPTPPPIPPASILSPVQRSDAQPESPDIARADDEKQDAHHSNNQNNQESLQLEIDRLNKEVSNLRGHNLQSFSMEQLVALQQTLLDSIQSVNKRIHQKQNDFQQCRICFDRNKCVLMQPCKHLATCQECSDRIEQCPICLSEIQATIIAFL